MTYPQLHLEIAESAQLTHKENHWPASIQFPVAHTDTIFKVPVPKELKQPRYLWLVKMDLKQLADLLNPTIH
ncbi:MULTISPECIES: hypothetical protein [Vibrio]|uniref:Uncharacterized protein n=2 Tax=Vibrio TaxID=662 RepID=A0A7X4LQL8_9VIBR|nr:MULTISPECIES: hypothetical protein [Vibrio]MBF9002809.1 hypothetical protein [Vibrio nitrifigilis]MBF9003623.1 hypothetical protein [Vibrio nitrifigilis]MZI95851.1 hypothetical protein [Vibrio eleionomae]